VNAIVAKKKDGQKILVVINAPGPINLPWKDKVDAIIFSGMGGSESGNGLTDVLFGDVNPSGHLPYVWGTIDQYPAQFDIFSNPTVYEYTEGVFVGQRWFDKKGYTPIFPFGFGLSYTTFSYTDLTVSYSSNKLVAKVKVQNSGGVDGDAVPMLFLKFPDSIKSKCQNNEYPSKLFKGFDKVFIKKGETKEVTIEVDEHSLSYYSVSDEKFVKATGTFTVYVGENAGNLPLSKDVEIS
jgi:beta-glucosidase